MNRMIIPGKYLLFLGDAGDGLDAERICAARAARPDVWLGVDGNQGFSRAALERLMPVLVETKVALVEQALPMDRDFDLDGPVLLRSDRTPRADYRDGMIWCPDNIWGGPDSGRVAADLRQSSAAQPI